MERQRYSLSKPHEVVKFMEKLPVESTNNVYLCSGWSMDSRRCKVLIGVEMEWLEER